MIAVYIIIIAIAVTLFSYNRILTENVERFNYKLSSGVVGGTYDVFMNTLNSQMVDKINNTTFSKELSTGSIKNLSTVNKYQNDFSLSQEDLFFDSILGINAFKKLSKPFENLRFVSAAYFEKAHLIVRDEPDEEIQITSFKDLVNTIETKKIVVGVGPERSGSEYNFILMCLINGKNPGNFDKPNELRGGKEPTPNFFYKNSDMNTMFNDFYNRKIDAIYLMTGAKNVYIANLVKLMNVKFVDLINNNSSLLKTAFQSYYYEKSINLGDYYNEAEQQDQVPTIATRVILFTHDKTPDDVVYNLVRDFYTKNYIYRNAVNPSEIKYFTEEYEPLDLAFCKQEYKIHPGARKFYLEQNLISSQDKFKYDLGYYHDEVIKNYWKFPEIGTKKFNFSRIL